MMDRDNKEFGTFYIDKNMREKGFVFLVKRPSEVENPQILNYADKLYVRAMRFLSNGVYVSLGRAFLEKSYHLGNHMAGNTLAYGWSVGWFGYIDYNKYVNIVRYLSVKYQYPVAMHNYAFAYEQGLGVKKNIHLAKYWYKRAIAAGYVDSRANLAFIYYNENTPDFNKIISLVKYCETPSECDLMGILYRDGYGVTKDLVKAFNLFKQAVDGADDPMAIVRLARCYKKGLGVEKDEEKAKALLKRAKELGYPPS